jgi:peptide-methionine (S)-S-oxide reductase
MRAIYWVVPALILAVAIIVWQVSRPAESAMPEQFPAPEPAATSDDSTVATFGNGCFWCTEAIFQQLKGVKTVTPGYTGGTAKNPSYEQVCTGLTGHAEGIQVTFDPKVITYAELLEVFWRSHDPTTLNRQGNDTGTQYRSAIFTHTPRQKELAEAYKAKIEAAHVFPAPVVTEIVPYTEFFPAEEHHRNFYSTNPRQGYCRAVIQPKLDKLQKVFADKWK